MSEGEFMTRFATKSVGWKLGHLAWVVCLFVPSVSSAAWLGYRNDTAVPIIVQTSVVANDRIVRGKEHKLFPGEIVYDNIPTSGPRQITVVDGKSNNLIGQETITVASQDIFLSLQLHSRPQTQGKAPVPPVLMLIPAKSPGPGGVVPPKDAPKNGRNTPVPPRTPLPPSSSPNDPSNPQNPSDMPNQPKSNDPKAPGQPQSPGTNNPNSSPGDQPKSNPSTPGTPTPGQPNPQQPTPQPLPPIRPKTKGGG
jgi:hypothetical protein